jgi:hypothetical protein
MARGRLDRVTDMENMMTKEFRGSGSPALILLAGAVIALAGCAAQAPALPAGFEQKIESASSRADHDDVASQYERQAAVDAAAAKRHVGYAATYRKNTSVRSGVQAHEALAKHCENLARTYQLAADENLVMAKLHRELAGSR